MYLDTIILNKRELIELKLSLFITQQNLQFICARIITRGILHPDLVINDANLA